MITSLTNERIKRLVLLREKSRIRNEEGLFLAEGVKMFEEAPLSRLREVYITEAILPRVEQRIALCRQQGIFVEQVTEQVMGKISDTRTPQGVLFVMEQFSYSLEEILDRAGSRQEGMRAPLFLLVEDIQDPGNLGTMMRTGEGAGVDGILLSRSTVDMYNPKTIRATMGSLYRVPFLYVDDLKETVAALQSRGIRIYAAHLEGKKYYDEVDLSGGCGFLIGNEGGGLSKEIADCADVCLKIPMEGQLESLNAAVAAALLLYQAAGYRKDSVKL